MSQSKKFRAVVNKARQRYQASLITRARMDGPLEHYSRPTKISQMVYWACRVIGAEHNERSAA